MTPYSFNSLFLRMRATSSHCFLTWYWTGETSQKVFTAIDSGFPAWFPEAGILCARIFKLYPPSGALERNYGNLKILLMWNDISSTEKKLRVKCRRFILLLKGTQVPVNSSHGGSLLKLGTSKQITDFHQVNHIMQECGDGITTVQSS